MKLEYEMETYGSILKEKTALLQQKQADLAAVDRTLGLHEIQVVPDQIANVRYKSNPLYFAHGEFNKAVFAILETAPSPMRVHEIAIAITKMQSTTLDEIAADALYESVKYALKNMKKRGTVIRMQDPRSQRGRLWTAGDAWRQKRIGRPPKI